MLNNRIDVIIPAYKAHDTILRALSSIAAQTIITDVDVLIVNDCCPQEDYSEYVKMFSPYFSIKEIQRKKNGGPSIARQTGLDNTYNEFIVFLDADDTFESSFSLQLLRSRISSNNKFQCCSSNFIEFIDSDTKMLLHHQDMIWLFGKIYRRSFLEKYQIRFIPSRASNQDAGFNALIKLYADTETEQICYTDDITYCWHTRENSITRIHDFQFEYDQSICGWVDNMIYVGNEFHKHKPQNDISPWLLSNLIILYCKYAMVSVKNTIFSEQCWHYIKKYYHMSFQLLYKPLNDTQVTAVIHRTLQDQYSNPSMYGVIPDITLFQFFDKLKKEVYMESDLPSIRRKLPPDVIEANLSCGILSAK